MLKLDEFLPYRLSVVTNRVSEVIARAYRDTFGLSIAEWRTLAATAESDGLTQQQIGLRTCMDKVTVSRAAIALAERGLITRTSGLGDKRARIIALSAKGRDLYARVVPKALALEARIFGKFEQDELDFLQEMLSRIDQTVGELSSLEADDFIMPY